MKCANKTKIQRSFVDPLPRRLAVYSIMASATILCKRPTWCLLDNRLPVDRRGERGQVHFHCPVTPCEGRPRGLLALSTPILYRPKAAEAIAAAVVSLLRLAANCPRANGDPAR